MEDAERAAAKRLEKKLKGGKRENGSAKLTDLCHKWSMWAGIAPWRAGPIPFKLWKVPSLQRRAGSGPRDRPCLLDLHGISYRFR